MEYIIIFPKQISNVDFTEPVTDMLTVIGVKSTSGSQNINKEFVLRFTTEYRITETQHRIIEAFLTSIAPLGMTISFAEFEKDFDFDDYIDTDLDGARIEIDFHDILHNLNKTITKMIPDARMQGKAKHEIVDLYKHAMKDWLAGKLF